MKSNLWSLSTNIKNGQLAKKMYVLHTKRSFYEAFLDILWNEGFISGYKICESDNSKLKIYLKYYQNQPAINKFHFVSKPSKKVYYSSKQIWKIDSNKNLIIFSTNVGLCSIVDCKKLRIGGEPLILVQ